MPSIVADLYSLKTASAAEIIGRISELSATLQGMASQVRQSLSGGSNGPKPLFPSSPSDERVLQIALLAILVDEMSYSASSPQRHDQVRQVEDACARLGIDYDDVVRASRHAPQTGSDY